MLQFFYRLDSKCGPYADGYITLHFMMETKSEKEEERTEGITDGRDKEIEGRLNLERDGRDGREGRTG